MYNACHYNVWYGITWCCGTCKMSAIWGWRRRMAPHLRCTGLQATRRRIPPHPPTSSSPLANIVHRDAAPLKGGWCHGSSLNPPCPSEASPPPPKLQPISDVFGLTSNPTGSSVSFWFFLTDSRMFLLSSFTWYSRFSLFTFRSPTSIPDFGLTYLTFGLCLWQLYSCWHGGNSSAWSLRITTVSVCHICLARPCLRESLYTSGLVSVSPSQPRLDVSPGGW